MSGKCLISQIDNLVSHDATRNEKAWECYILVELHHYQIAVKNFYFQEYFMDLYLLAELKTISLKITTVDMKRPPVDFRSNFEVSACIVHS